MRYPIILSVLLMILLKIIRSPFWITFVIFLLTLNGQTALYSFYFKPTFLLLAVVAIYIIGYKIFLDRSPVTIHRVASIPIIASAAFGKTLFDWIQALSVIEKSGLFLLFTGIILYLYVRTAAKDYYGGQFLVNEPIPLEEPVTFMIKPTYHCSLSAWFYLTPSTRVEQDNIFLYGDQMLVSYQGNINSLRIRLKDNISYIKKSVKLQKWNHFAFIYDHGKIVLFLNGEVIHTSLWTPPSFTNDLITGKAQGKVCNIRYYNQALEERFVQSLYEDFKHKNPPII